MRFFFLLSFFITNLALHGQNALPVISNLAANIDIDAERITINYDVSDTEETELEIRLLVSANGGKGFVVNTSSATGDVGPEIPVGNGKQIIWAYGDQLWGAGNYLIKLVADDHFEINIQEIVDQVSLSGIQSDLSFVNGIRHRTANPGHLQNIKNEIEARIEAAGLFREVHEFPAQNYTGQNFIGRHGGHYQDSSVIIIDAHYDTVNNAPGADDNGSGTVGVWEAMRILSGFHFKKTIKFIHFDLEESGLLGSFSFVSNQLREYENYEAVLNYEMIGYSTEEPNTQTIPLGFDLIFPEATAQIQADDNRGNFITNVSNESSTGLMVAFTNAATTYVPELKVIELAAPGNAGGALSDLRRSDHAPFWDAGIHALMLTDGANFRNPNYHTSSDNLSTINFEFMEQVIKATIATAATLAIPVHTTEATVELNIVSAVKTPACEPEISPNPARGFINLHFGDCYPAGASLEIYDITGRLFHSRNLDNNEERKLKIPLSGMPPGLFLIKIKDNNRELVKKFVIKF